MNVFGWYDQEITELLPNFLGVTVGIEAFFSLSPYVATFGYLALPSRSPLQTGGNSRKTNKILAFGFNLFYLSSRNNE